MSSFDYAIHSDFLIHWTGKDIDSQYDQQWYESDKSDISKKCDVSEHYLKRLADILKFGLWMTEENTDALCVNGHSVPVPAVPQTCFTELKLSESRKHARKFGRLGIGFKRPFVINREGRPVIYHSFLGSHDKDKFINNAIIDFKDKTLLNYLKPANSTKILNYDLYSESEWRIIFNKDLLSTGKIFNPGNKENTEAFTYYENLEKNQQDMLNYLIPLDGWLSMIIYPSLAVKNEAYRKKDLRDAIKEIKKRGAFKDEQENWPIEMDLDACRNF